MLMKSAPSRLKPSEYIDQLVVSSRYTFTTADAKTALGLSAVSLRVALNRLAARNLIASPVRGFHIIIPPEYRSLGCLPAEQFVPTLMKSLRIPYYAGLLTAAQHHGAAHQRPQEFQVFVEKARRPLACGRVRVVFIVRKNLREVPIRSFNTPRGALTVSTPEATAFDLVGYQHHAGGLSQVATVLSELAEKIEPKALASAAETAPISWAQRLGYLLERVGASEKTPALKAYVRRHTHESTLLLPNAARGQASRNEDWKLFVNTEVEFDL